LTTEKWRPIVIKIFEEGQDFNRANLYILEFSGLKESSKRVRITQRETPGLIEVSSRRIKGSGRRPKVLHELHGASIIPDINSNQTARFGGTGHLSEHLVGVRDKVEDEAGDNNIINT
jgi:hypothetical protein